MTCSHVEHSQSLTFHCKIKSFLKHSDKWINHPWCSSNARNVAYFFLAPKMQSSSPSADIWSGEHGNVLFWIIIGISKRLEKKKRWPIGHKLAKILPVDWPVHTTVYVLHHHFLKELWCATCSNDGLFTYKWQRQLHLLDSFTVAFTLYPEWLTEQIAQYPPPGLIFHWTRLQKHTL